MVSTLRSVTSGHMADVIHLPPRGKYLAYEVGRLAGVSGHTIGQWARRGLIRSSQNRVKGQRIYSFQDAAEAMAVHELEALGLPPKDIRQAVIGLRTVYGDWPLQVASILVPTGHGTRRHDIAVLRGGEVFDAKFPTQPTMSDDMFTLDLGQIVFDLRRGGWAARQLPKLEHIEVDPDLMSGKPTIKGTRLPVEDVIALSRSEDGLAELRTDFGLTVRQIRDAQDWWEAVQAFEEVA